MSATRGRPKYIERYEVMNIINGAIEHNALSYEGCVNEIMESVMKTPAADVVERKTGKWLDGGLDGIGVMGIEYRWQKCSECGSEFLKAPGASYPNYCSMCGADMRGDEH